MKVMKTRTIIGILLIVAGAWKLANMWGIIDNDWLWRQPWTAYVAPVLLLYVGTTTIVDSYRRDPDQWLQRPLPIGEDGKRICCSVHYGGDEYLYRGEAFHGARLDAFCGGIRMDLREAVITEDEEIDIHTFCGGIELFVPTHVNVVASPMPRCSSPRRSGHWSGSHETDFPRPTQSMKRRPREACFA